MATAPSMSVDSMTLRRQLLEKIDDARDVHVTDALKAAVTAAYAAYEEDKKELGLQAPSKRSLKGMLKFLAHPYRIGWIPPSVAINPEGHFIAVWDVVPNRYTVEFLGTNAADWIGILRTYDSVNTRTGHYDNFDVWNEPPFAIPRRVGQ